jgi:uncharacterized protein (TIGR04255 family)
MPFPAVDRVIYGRNPLVEVICQVRFPAILRIEVEPPAAFQQVNREAFPVFTETSGIEGPLSLPPEVAQQLPEAVTRQLSALRMAIGSGQKSYSFASDDAGQTWTLVLTREALSLTTKSYAHWGEFRGRLEPAVNALIGEYAPAHFSRVGLRYRDLICRSDLGLAEVPWSDLLQPYIAGELASADVAPEVMHAARQLIVALPDQRGQVLLQHGLNAREEPPEACFVIDCDFYSAERTEVGDVWGLLEGLHGQAGRLFRWCIKPRLHDALDPHQATD